MIKTTLWVGAIVAALLLGAHSALSDGGLLRFAKLHPTSPWAGRRLPFYAGQLFYAVQNYEEARQYFEFVSRNVPKTSQGEESAFYYIVTGRLLGRAKQQDYVDFLETYSTGTYRSTVMQYLDSNVAINPR